MTNIPCRARPSPRHECVRSSYQRGTYGFLDAQQSARGTGTRASSNTHYHTHYRQHTLSNTPSHQHTLSNTSLITSSPYTYTFNPSPLFTSGFVLMLLTRFLLTSPLNTLAKHTHYPSPLFTSGSVLRFPIHTPSQNT